MPPIDAAKNAHAAALPPMNAEILEICQPIVEGLTQYNGALCDGYAAMGNEWLNFVNRRLHTDLSLPGRLAKCRSPQDFFGEWSTFMTTAAEDYRTEFSRLAEINSAATQRAMSSVQANGISKSGVFPRNV
jgi:Phasin protein